MIAGQLDLLDELHALAEVKQPERQQGSRDEKGQLVRNEKEEGRARRGN